KARRRRLTGTENRGSRARASRRRARASERASRSVPSQHHFRRAAAQLAIASSRLRNAAQRRGSPLPQGVEVSFILATESAKRGSWLLAAWRGEEFSGANPWCRSSTTGAAKSGSVAEKSGSEALGQRLLEILDEVLRILDADREAQGRVRDAEGG